MRDGAGCVKPGIQCLRSALVPSLARTECVQAWAHRGYNIIHSGSDQPVALLNAIQSSERLTGKRARLEYRPRDPVDVPITWADIGKARTALGCRPRTPFENGIGKVVAW